MQKVKKKSIIPFFAFCKLQNKQRTGCDDICVDKNESKDENIWKIKRMNSLTYK